MEDSNKTEGLPFSVQPIDITIFYLSFGANSRLQHQPARPIKRLQMTMANVPDVFQKMN